MCHAVQQCGPRFVPLGRTPGGRSAWTLDRVGEVSGSMVGPVAAAELSAADLLVGKRQRQQRVPSGGHGARRRQPVRRSCRCARTATATHTFMGFIYSGPCIP